MLHRDPDAAVDAPLAGRRFIAVLDERSERVLVDAELRDLDSTITSIDDVVSNEITQAMMEVVEVEVTDRVQQLISTALDVNQSSAANDLADILRRADTGPHSCHRARPMSRAVSLDRLPHVVAWKSFFTECSPHQTHMHAQPEHASSPL